MVGAVARRRQIMSIMFNIATLALRVIQTIIESASNDKGEIIHNFSLLDNSISCSKLLFVAAYHAAHTEGPPKLAWECLLGSSCITFCTIMFHLKGNRKTWAATQNVGMGILLALGFYLLHYEKKIPMDHAWHTVVVPSIMGFLVWVEGALLIRTQIKQDGGNKHLLRDLLMKLGETPISIYRCVDLIQNPDSRWDAQKILLLLGSGPPMIVGACQISWIVYKAGIISKVVKCFMKIPRVFTRKTKQGAGATMGGNGGRDAGDQVADERVETGNGLPVTIGASKVSRIAYIAGIMFKFIKWIRKNHGVSAVEDEQAAGAAMEKYGDGDSGQQVHEEKSLDINIFPLSNKVHEEELKVVVASQP